MTDWTTLNYIVVDAEGNGRQPPEWGLFLVRMVVRGEIMGCAGA
jgi:hypothetical protein